jgi:hypothetical protein
MTEPLNGPLPASSPPGAARTAEDLRGDEPVPYPDIDDRPAIQPDRDTPPTTPRWVKAFVIIGVVLLLLLAGLHLAGKAPTHMPSASGMDASMQVA